MQQNSLHLVMFLAVVSIRCYDEGKQFTATSMITLFSTCQVNIWKQALAPAAGSIITVVNMDTKHQKRYCVTMNYTCNFL